MLNQDINLLPIKTRIDVICDYCFKSFDRTIRNIKKTRKNNDNQDLCKNCSCKKYANKKPQCSPEYWTDKKKLENGEKIKNSPKYIAGIKNIDIKGEKNHMYGKKHTTDTLSKMSKSRTGKLGENATAWKGGKQSLNSRLKKLLRTRFNWYKKIFERDNYTCQKCNIRGGRLDAHHIKKFSLIIKELLINHKFLNDEDKLEWLIEQPEIKDLELINGITLCRACHKLEHSNWGSHN